METPAEAVAAPVVATKTESSVTSESAQEVRVEKIANGTVESTASSEMTVSQSVTVSSEQQQQQRYKFRLSSLLKSGRIKCVVHFAVAASWRRSSKNHRLQLLWWVIYSMPFPQTNFTLTLYVSINHTEHMCFIFILHLIELLTSFIFNFFSVPSLRWTTRAFFDYSIFSFIKFCRWFFCRFAFWCFRQFRKLIK